MVIINKKSLFIFIIIMLFSSLIYLYLLGEGFLLSIVHSMMDDTNIGGFIIKEGSSTVIDCNDFHKKFPEYINTKNIMTDPIALKDGSGLYERFVKVDKSVIDSSSLSWKDKIALSLTSSEPKCAKSLGTFIKSVVNIAK